MALAARVLIIQKGETGLDMAIRPPRPRGYSGVAALEGIILRDLFRNIVNGEDS